MTQYNHEMVFSDAELTMIEAALVRIHAYSKDKVANGAGPPHLAIESDSEDLLIRVHSSHYAMDSKAPFDFDLDDSELWVLEDALEFMIDHCSRMAGEDAGQSWSADKKRAEDVLERIDFCKKNCSL